MTLVLIIVIVIGLIALWRPLAGLAAIVFILPAYLLRTELFGIPTTALEVSLYALAVVVGILLATRRLPWHWVKMTRGSWVLLGGWSLAWVLATALSPAREAALGAFKAWFLDPLLFTALLAIIVRTEAARRRLVQAALLSGTAVAVIGLIQLGFVRDSLQEGRLSSVYAPVANYAAMYLGPLAVLGLAIFTLGYRRDFSTLLMTSVMIIALVFTKSYGAYLAVAAAALFIWHYLPPTKIKRGLLVAGMLGAIVVVLGLSRTYHFQQHFDFSGRSSGSVRMEIWTTSWELIKQRPWFGVGPNNFEMPYREVAPTLFHPPLEWLVAQPHNLYLALWLETGLLGLLTFIALVVYHLVVAWRVLLPKQRAIVVANVACLIAVLVHGLVDTPYFKNDLALEFMLLAVLPWLGQSTET